LIKKTLIRHISVHYSGISNYFPMYERKRLTLPKKCVQLYNYESVIEQYYTTLVKKHSARKLKEIHIPLSDVFYVREAIYNKTGVRYTLDHVERAMYLEGHLDASDVLDPHVPRGYCSYDNT
jgi:hypothetical protein